MKRLLIIFTFLLLAAGCNRTVVSQPDSSTLTVSSSSTINAATNPDLTNFLPSTAIPTIPITTSTPTVKAKIVSKINPQPKVQSPEPTQVQPTPTPPPLNSTLCNGIYYTACSAGQNFICPTSGTAYCQLNQQEQAAEATQQQAAALANQKAQALASLEAQLQSLQNELATVNSALTSENNEIQKYQTEWNQQCSNLGSVSLSNSLGQQGIEEQEQAGICLGISQAQLSSTSAYGVIQKQAAYIQQQINTINSLILQQ